MQDKHYSKALERCIEYTKDEGDIVGLLSYALYKSTLREAARSDDGYLPASHQRNLTTNQLKQLSNLASSMLADYADKQYPEEKRTNAAAIDHAKEEIISEIKKLSWQSGILKSLSASAITAILIFLFYASVQYGLSLPSFFHKLLS